MNTLAMYIPITKVDAAQRLVYGVATAEQQDRAKEICDYVSTKPFYEKWSGDIAKASGGKSLGNVRAMHGKVAAGKVTQIAFNDDAKKIEICTKIVDDAEWNKVDEGVYTGFSQGGAYVKRWKGDDGVMRYTADPSEISLVDLPCLPSATFEMIKADGATEQRHFALQSTVRLPSNTEVVARAEELAKAAGDTTKWAQHIDAARAELTKIAEEAALKIALVVVEEATDVEKSATADSPPHPAEGEVEQVWLAKDKTPFAKKADALAHNAKTDATAAAKMAASPVLDALNDIGAKLGLEKQDWSDKERRAAAANGHAAPGSAKKVDRKRDLAKDLGSVARLASLIQELRWLQQCEAFEAAQEGDGSSAPAQLMQGIQTLCTILMAIAEEETSELSGGDNAGEAMAQAAGTLRREHLDALTKFAGERPALAKAAEVLVKAGARNSRADQDKIQAMHDHSVDLGAKCAGEAEKTPAGGDLAKVLSKMTAITAERDALKDIFERQVKPVLDEIFKKVANIEAQPLPLPIAGNFRAVNKSAEFGGADGTMEEQFVKMTPDAQATFLIKMAQRQPQQLGIAR